MISKYRYLLKFSYLKVFIGTVILTIISWLLALAVDDDNFSSLLISISAGGVTGIVFFLLSTVKTKDTINLEIYDDSARQALKSIHSFIGAYTDYKKGTREGKYEELNYLHSMVLSVMVALDKLESNPYFNKDFKKYTGKEYISFYKRIQKRSSEANELLMKKGYHFDGIPEDDDYDYSDEPLNGEETLKVSQYIESVYKLLRYISTTIVEMIIAVEVQKEAVKNSII